MIRFTDYDKAITIAQGQVRELKLSILYPSMDYKDPEGQRWAYELDDVVRDCHGNQVTGVVQFVSDEVWIEDGGEVYTSRPLTNPKWRDLLLAADKSIEVTQDRHHVFLEAVSLDYARTAEAESLGFEMDVYAMSFGS